MPENDQECLELATPSVTSISPCDRVAGHQSRPWRNRELKAPNINGSLFAEPALSEIQHNAILNHALLSDDQTSIQGRTLAELRNWTREQTIQLACKYTGQLREQTVERPDYDLIYCTGHQPALFHPGVWSKNIAISKAAGNCSRASVSLNLIVDQDLCGSYSIPLPIGNRAAPSMIPIPYDARRAACPWEERHVHDCELFASFGERVTAAMAAWGISPIISQYWHAALKQMRRTQLIGEGFTAMRHAIEQEWDVRNLELPFSRVCQSAPFYWFASHILINLCRFQNVYNEVLAEYRQINHIRSRTHPVPALTTADAWLEAPFWIWQAGSTQRKPLFARQVKQETWLSDGDAIVAKLPLHVDSDPMLAIDKLQELTNQGIRLRTRALTTTLFARLLLADMFVHGIGGSKYDEMTDQIIHRFYRLHPPTYQTLTATLHLPFADAYNVSHVDLQKSKQQLRDLQYNSDRHVNPEKSAELSRHYQQKQQLIRSYHNSKTTGLTRKQRLARRPERSKRDAHFRNLRNYFARQTQPQQQALQTEIQQLEQQLNTNRIIQNREFAYCLYPEDYVRSFIADEI